MKRPGPLIRSCAGHFEPPKFLGLTVLVMILASPPFRPPSHRQCYNLRLRTCCPWFGCHSFHGSWGGCRWGSGFVFGVGQGQCGDILPSLFVFVIPRGCFIIIIVPCTDYAPATATIVPILQILCAYDMWSSIIPDSFYQGSMSF